jgi:hypothetical protein
VTYFKGPVPFLKNKARDNHEADSYCFLNWQPDSRSSLRAISIVEWLISDSYVRNVGYDFIVRGVSQVSGWEGSSQ